MLRRCRAPALPGVEAWVGWDRSGVWRESGRQTRDRRGNEGGTPKRVCEAAGYAGSEQFHGMVLSNIDDRDAAAPGRKPAPGPEWRKAGGLQWMNAVGDHPAGGGPVSPGSRMSTRARPPLTTTSGAPSALRRTVTRGLSPGGAGGSAASVVTVPACSMKRIRMVPPATSMPPGGRRPVSVTMGGSPLWLKQSGMEIAVSPQGSTSSPSAMASTNVGPQ